MAAGIKQGFPLSGNQLALAADGLIRASMTATFLRSARICLFVDDVAVVVYDNGLALDSSLALMDRCRLAMGPTLRCIWEASLAKATSQISDIAAAPRLINRGLGFKTQFASLLPFKAQFAEFGKQVHQTYRWAVQRIARSP